MRKRARLARRILREHRQGYEGHFTKIGSVPLRQWWTCTHCRHYHPGGTPRAYR